MRFKPGSGFDIRSRQIAGIREINGFAPENASPHRPNDGRMTRLAGAHKGIS